jgi:hypothetical protein
MSVKGFHKRVFWIFMIMGIFSFLVNIQISEAYRRRLNLHDALEDSMITHREVEINGKIFDLFVDQAKKSITVRGKVETWEEQDKVQEHFRLRSPSDYGINYKIDMLF